MSARGRFRPEGSQLEGMDIVVPGSIANLGPGFDALAVAVGIYLRVRIVEVRPSAPGTLEMEFEGRPPIGENRIAMAFARAAAARPGGGHVPGLRVSVQSDIPMRAGLGSSAAATVAGLRLYEAVSSPRNVSDWLEMATAIEGHPDNAAAALLGGIALSCQREDGRVMARAWAWPASIRFVVATPEAELETAFARTVVPQTMALRDAVFNLQRVLLFVRALETGAHADLREALRDRWHQPARTAFVPGLAEALTLDHPAILGVCLSGAGPSIAALVTDGQAEAAGLLGAIYQRLGVPYTIRELRGTEPFSTGEGYLGTEVAGASAPTTSVPKRPSPVEKGSVPLL